MFFQGLAGVQNGFVLDSRGDDMFMLREDMTAGRKTVVLIERGEWAAHERIDYPEDGVIVGFGATAGEDDFLRARADEGSDLFACGFDGGAGTLGRSVDGGSGGEFAREIRKHVVENF